MRVTAREKLKETFKTKMNEGRHLLRKRMTKKRESRKKKADSKRKNKIKTTT